MGNQFSGLLFGSWKIEPVADVKRHKIKHALADILRRLNFYRSAENKIPVPVPVAAHVKNRFVVNRFQWPVGKLIAVMGAISIVCSTNKQYAVDNACALF